jgi:hypothetical protein
MTGTHHPDGHRGHYFGTEIDGSWWRRYRHDGFFARGRGRYWFDDQAFYFQKTLTREPMVIPLRKVVAFEVARWHAGQWGAFAPVLKIIWKKDGQRLGSGFAVARSREGVQMLIDELLRLKGGQVPVRG